MPHELALFKSHSHRNSIAKCGRLFLSIAEVKKHRQGLSTLTNNPPKHKIINRITTAQKMTPFKDLIQSLSIAACSFIIGTSLPYISWTQISPQKPSPPVSLPNNPEKQTSNDLQNNLQNDFPPASITDILEATTQNGTLLIDARPKAFYDLGHIPTAINLPAQPLNADSLKTLPSAQRAIVYCSNPHCPDSKKVAQALLNQIRSIQIYKEGWDTWNSLYPTSTP
jgi:rhodanese-related sulfurtransferase